MTGAFTFTATAESSGYCEENVLRSEMISGGG